MKKSLILITGLVLVLTAGFVMADNLEKQQELKRAVIRVDGITCGGCFSSINAGVSELDGFSGMGANLFRKLIAVDFAAPLTADRIADKLAEIGYPGRVESVEPVSKKESFATLQSRRSAFRSASGCSAGSSCGVAGPGAAPRNAAPLKGGSCCDLPPADPVNQSTENL